VLSHARSRNGIRVVTEQTVLNQQVIYPLLQRRNPIRTLISDMRGARVRFDCILGVGLSEVYARSGRPRAVVRPAAPMTWRTVPVQTRTNQSQWQTVTLHR